MQAAPVITNITPLSGGVGTVVTVRGSGLGAATVARVGAVPGTILSSTATSLSFVVGAGSVTSSVYVADATGTSNAAPFQVLPTLPPGFEPVDTVSGAFTALNRCDDCFEQIDLGFSFSFFGRTYTQCYISNNGCVSFTAGISGWNGQAFPTTFGPLIAPYWGDVDTRGAGGRVWYKLYPDRLVILWSQVGYYPTLTDKKNTFQLILRRNTVAPAPPTSPWPSVSSNGYGARPAAPTRRWASTRATA